MTISEKLQYAAENIPKVYEAGKEAGRRQAENNVAYAESISPSDERFVYSDSAWAWYTGNVLSISGDGTITINAVGYVEFSFTIIAPSCKIYVDGNIVYDFSTSEIEFSNEIFEFAGQVNESIYITGTLADITVNRFWIFKQEESLQNILDTAKVEGKKAEYDAFWDDFQSKGKRYNYNQAFYGLGWTDENYNPKYPFGQPKYVAGMFAQSAITDTKQPLDLTNCSSTSNLFQSCQKLKTIRTLTVSENTPYNGLFSLNGSLENIEFAGTIGQKGINLEESPKLTTASLLSILTALSKDSTVAAGKTVTFATASKAVIEADTECLEQYNLAKNAGWEILFT